MVKSNKGYEDLIVWQKAIDLSVLVYECTRAFPKEEIYGLTSQMRRCAVSVASNIAEGCARNNSGEFSHFLGIASGSVAELKTQLIICQRINIVIENNALTLMGKVVEIERMLSALAKSIKKPQKPNLQLATYNEQLS